MFVEPIEKFAKMLPFMEVQIPRIQESIGGNEDTFALSGVRIDGRSCEAQEHRRGL